MCFPWNAFLLYASQSGRIGIKRILHMFYASLHGHRRLAPPGYRRDCLQLKNFRPANDAVGSAVLSSRSEPTCQ